MTGQLVSDLRLAAKEVRYNRGQQRTPEVNHRASRLEALADQIVPGFGADDTDMWVGHRCDYCHRFIDGTPGYEDEDHTTVCLNCVPALRAYFQEGPA